MHLSKQTIMQRRNTGKEDAPSPAKSRITGRTKIKPTSVSNMGARTVAENHHKKFRTRNPSFSTSSTDDHIRRLLVPSTATETVEESCVVLPTGSGMRGASSSGRGADCCTVSRSNSLPSLAASPKNARSKTFVFMYDETEKRSKPVKPPDELNISLPVLVQYELTEEDALMAADRESSSQPGDVAVNSPTTGTFYTSPTVELLQKWDKKEKRNKGMHVMRWLVQVQN